MLLKRLDLGQHFLLATFASWLIMAGVDLRTVQELGGWSDLKMVQRYAHLSPAHKVEAVEKLAQFPYSFPYGQEAPLAAVR